MLVQIIKGKDQDQDSLKANGNRVNVVELHRYIINDDENEKNKTGKPYEFLEGVFPDMKKNEIGECEVFKKGKCCVECYFEFVMRKACAIGKKEVNEEVINDNDP